MGGPQIHSVKICFSEMINKTSVDYPNTVGAFSGAIGPIGLKLALSDNVRDVDKDNGSDCNVDTENLILCDLSFI